MQMLADGTSQGAAISKQEDSLIGEALEEPSSLAERKDRSGKCSPSAPDLPAVLIHTVFQKGVAVTFRDLVLKEARPNMSKKRCICHQYAYVNFL